MHRSFFPSMVDAHREFDRLVGDLLGGSRLVERQQFPALNLWQSENALHLEAEMPGVQANDVDISVVGRDLTIQGKRELREVEGAAWLRRERGAGAFARVVRLPFEVEADQVAARFANGVLSVELPKAAIHRARKIVVNQAN
jgi:HSP20 family protein